LPKCVSSLINKINQLESGNPTFEWFNLSGMQNYLVVIVGPTAVGKTKVAVEIAKFLRCAVLNADSRQVFKELNIGTAKPTLEEMQGVKHYFVNDRSIQEDFSAGQFEQEALEVLDKEFIHNDFTILSGGSGLYVDALCFGMNYFPEPDLAIREMLNLQFEQEGLTPLQARLQKLDPAYAELVDLENPQRVIRALEICLSTGQLFSAFRSASTVERQFKPIFIGLELPREILYSRINNRMDSMIGAGLFAEARSVEEYKHINALQTIGYKEIYDHFDGHYDEAEAVRLLKRNSRRLAKRQMTWFKKNEGIRWFHPQQIDEIKNHLLSLHNTGS
jgi:tRNA dimethylallyltransferase